MATMPKVTVHYSLAEAVEAVRNDQDTVLELDRWAEIGDSGATELSVALRKNENLEVLILGSQNIGPPGAQVPPIFCLSATRLHIALCLLGPK